jgi:hypothetical protein
MLRGLSQRALVKWRVLYAVEAQEREDAANR